MNMKMNQRFSTFFLFFPQYSHDPDIFAESITHTKHVSADRFLIVTSLKMSQSSSHWRNNCEQKFEYESSQYHVLVRKFLDLKPADSGQSFTSSTKYEGKSVYSTTSNNHNTSTGLKDDTKRNEKFL